jgi:hypothetical protein
MTTKDRVPYGSGPRPEATNFPTGNLSQNPPSALRPAFQPGMELRHFNQEQLARRWSISPRTLERWRWLQQGPPYLRIGGRVVYRLSDVENYEASKLHQRDGTTEKVV